MYVCMYLPGVPIIMASNVQQQQQHPCTTSEETKHQRARAAVKGEETVGACHPAWPEEQLTNNQEEQLPHQHPVPSEQVLHQRKPRQHQLLHHQRRLPTSLPARGRLLISEGARRREVRGCGAGGGGLLCCTLDLVNRPAKLLQIGFLLAILLLATHGDLVQAEGNVGEFPIQVDQINNFIIFLFIFFFIVKNWYEIPVALATGHTPLATFCEC